MVSCRIGFNAAPDKLDLGLQDKFNCNWRDEYDFERSAVLEANNQVVRARSSCIKHGHKFVCRQQSKWGRVFSGVRDKNANIFYVRDELDRTKTKTL